MDVRSRRMEGHVQTGTVSPGVGLGAGGRARGEAETRLQPWPLQCSYQGVQGHSDSPRQSQTSKCWGSCVPPDPLTPWAPELTKDVFPPPASHLCPGPPPGLRVSQTAQTG